MTTINIQKDSGGSYRGFVCMGHAGYTRRRLFWREPDILCSAVSALVIGAVNALQELAGEELEVKKNEASGFLSCSFGSRLQEKSVFLMDALVFTLEGLSREYGERYLKITFEEV